MGRNIASHQRLFDDIINNLNVINSSGALIALDFGKAFDTVRKECLIEAMQIFNFGANFIKLIVTVMQNTENCVHNGGWLSGWFPTERGIRQGWPLSPLLFIIASRNSCNKGTKQ